MPSRGGRAGARDHPGRDAGTGPPYAAGHPQLSAAVSRAHDFCTAYPTANVLIVSCEFCSLLYQPTDLGVGSLLSNGLFGDALSAAVVRGTGMRLERNASHLVPDTESWISYAVRETGFHFLLDKRVPGTMRMLAPALRALTAAHGWEAGTWTSSSSTPTAPASSTTCATTSTWTTASSASAAPP